MFPCFLIRTHLSFFLSFFSNREIYSFYIEGYQIRLAIVGLSSCARAKMITAA